MWWCRWQYSKTRDSSYGTDVGGRSKDTMTQSVYATGGEIRPVLFFSVTPTVPHTYRRVYNIIVFTRTYVHDTII